MNAESIQVSPRIRRIGRGMVNSYLVEDGGDVTIVDAGAPAYWGQLPAELAAIGRSLDDVRSVVLTHGHSDHIGFAERIRSERGTPIRVHELDAALARGEVPNPAKGLGPTRFRPLLEFMLFSLRNGMMRIPRITEVATFGDGTTLDVPGAPRVILVPGHTPGSAALLFGGHDALFVGDAMATHSVTTGDDGPRISPFTADPVQALASLDRLLDVQAGLVLPGHGEAWSGGVAAAVSAVRAAAAISTVTRQAASVGQ
jgi:glyoxylase-like metal-dependent hydrolase (beta-lactamase superfamily II)